MWRRPKKGSTVDFKILQLSPTFKKQEDPACNSCGYDAERMLALVEEEKSIDRFFCDRCLRDAFLDAINFSCRVPDSL